MAEAKTKSPLPINPELLAWARNHAGLSIEEAANKIKVSPERIEAWEDINSTLSPTVRQARILAEYYDRHFLEFFAKSKPKIKEYESIPDFRLYRGARDPSKTLELKKLHAWAETQRINALDLYSEIGEKPRDFPSVLFSSVTADPECKAKLAREILKFSVEDQLSVSSDEREKLQNLLRDKIERIGVLTFKITQLTGLDARGFCLAHFPLPAIAFGKESPRAQAFTLMHEFAHVMLRQSAVSGGLTRFGGVTETRQVELWCDRFAASFLMPEEEVKRIFPSRPEPADSISDEFLRRIANKFSVSDHAALVRLVHLGLVKPGFYWEIKRPEFDSYEAEYRGGGRPLYYGTRYKNKLGKLYTSLVLQAWQSGRITNHNAAEFMGIKNLKHLRDIKAEFDS